jgi:hypothetical protein
MRAREDHGGIADRQTNFPLSEISGVARNYFMPRISPKAALEPVQAAASRTSGKILLYRSNYFNASYAALRSYVQSLA